MRTGSERSRSRSNTRRPSLPSAYAKDAPATPAPTTITSHCRARARGDKRIESHKHRQRRFRHASIVDRVADRAARRIDRGTETLTTPPSRVRDVTAAATRARRRRSSQPRRISGGSPIARPLRERREAGCAGDRRRTSDAAPADAVASPPRPIFARSRASCDSVSQRPGRCDSRTTTGVERRGAGRATIRGARADVPMHWSETRRALRVCGGDARARRVAGATVQADKCFVYARGRKPRFWITPSRLT